MGTEYLSSLSLIGALQMWLVVLYIFAPTMKNKGKIVIA